MNRAVQAEDAPAELWQSLNGVQIFFIVISAVIGTGVFSGNGEALYLSGPVGLLLDVIALGVLTLCVGETVSELVQVWAVPNAVYEYVAAFVDRDIAWVVAILYWYSFAAAFASQMIAAAKLFQYWGLAPIWPPLIFFGLVPVALFVINMAGIHVYGWVETFFGLLKAVLLFGVTCVLYDISTKDNYAGPDGPITEWIQHDPNLTSNAAHAVFYGMPAVAYSFIGIETAIVAAFESQSSRSMAFPSRFTHWFIYVTYLMCTLGLALTVRWDDEHLQRPLAELHDPRSNSPTIIAIFKDGRTTLAGFVNGCLIMSVVSAATTSLYVASRTLYGLVYSLSGTNWFSNQLKYIGFIWRTTGVPTRALIITAMLFYWQPWLYQIGTVTVDDVLSTLSTTASMACVVVWGFLCLAFHRFELWTRRCRNALLDTQNGNLRHFIRGTTAYEECPDRKVWNLGMSFQPWLARVGVIGSLMVSVTASASWWKPGKSATVLNVASAYAVHIVAFVLWLILKLYRLATNSRNMEWFVPLEGGANPTRLIETLEHLDFVSASAARRGEGQYNRNARAVHEQELGEMGPRADMLLGHQEQGHRQ
ncbi:amino acid permease-domain-containing protein [Podospora didyma]|uniref:Amino acid permease-domain-containing protein n=1 Tax=Podospora didyma TaxID=330526 RepID=A0AAE0KJX0_9PEZI|nr:amino acid permease-domain-containing protein [Podospora didyma]